MLHGCSPLSVTVTNTLGVDRIQRVTLSQSDESPCPISCSFAFPFPFFPSWRLIFIRGPSTKPYSFAFPFPFPFPAGAWSSSDDQSRSGSGNAASSKLSKMACNCCCWISSATNHKVSILFNIGWELPQRNRLTSRCLICDIV